MKGDSSVVFSSQHQEDIDGFCPFYFTCNDECLQQSYLYDYGIAGSLCVLSVIFSIYFICMHKSYYTNPHFQSKIIVILLMAPFYSVISVLSITFHSIADYLTLIRDVYEAFLLFTFFYLIFSYLAYDEKEQKLIDERVYIRMIEHEKQVVHMFPFNLCTKPYKLTCPAKAKYFTYRCKKYVLQFFVFKPILSVFLLIFEFFQGSEFIASVDSFIRIFIATSVTYSLYYLILFYQALKKPLAPWHPLLKFLTIKITLFFTFWQDLTLEYVLKEPLLNCFDKSSPHFNEERILNGIENTFVCFEMCLMAIAGGIAYSYKPFIHGEVKQSNLTDVLKDNWDTFKRDFRLIKPKKFGFKETFKQQNYTPDPTRISKIENIELDTPNKNLYENLNMSYV
ncbi:hypothetical protein ABPG74_022198 [Tetrahymena malaccensis]